MKLIYSQIKYMACFLLLVGTTGSMFAQCPPGATQACVVYTNGSFDNENGWMLWDATTSTEIACIANNETGSTTGTETTYNYCVTNGNTIELYAYETFGDGWNTGTMIRVDLCEDGSLNGCDPQTNNVVPITAGAGASNMDPNCGGGIGAGVLAGTFVTQEMGTGCIECVECVADITVNNDPGVCGAFLDLDNPVDNGCGLGGVPINPVTVEGAVIDLNVTGVTLDMETPYSLTGVPTMAASCLTEVCFFITTNTDNGAGFETIQIEGEDGQIIGSTATGGGDCNDTGGDVCIPLDLYNTYAADGTIDLIFLPNTGVNFCTVNTVQVILNTFLGCETFSNDFNNTGDAADTYPVGTTIVTFSSTLGGLPISCATSVTVVDNEAPVLSCPNSTTVSLDAGECSTVYYYVASATDNCDLATIPVGAPVDVPGVFGGLDDCPGSGNTLSCGAGRTAQVQELDITGLPANVEITEGCFIFDNTAWGNTQATINFYIDAPGLSAAQSPLPCYNSGATAVATSGLVTLPAANAGVAVCVPVPAFLVDPSSDGLYMEVETTGGAVSFNGTSCNGITADGTNTFLCSDGCGAGYFATFGFDDIDAFFAFTAQEVSFTAPNGGGPGTGTNEFESGDEIPFGTSTCFSFSAMDVNGNNAQCDWCVTVNQFPEANQTTTLACNDNINVSVDESCGAALTADLILEGGPYGCYETYNVMIEGVAPANAINGNGSATVMVDASRIPAFQSAGMAGPYKVSVIDPDNSNNSCWGYVMFEDKLAPTVTCEDVTISCITPTTPAQPVTGSASAASSDELQWGDGTTGEIGSVTASASAPAGAKISDINVSVQLDHSWSGDLTVVLTSPEGVSVELAGGVCGINDNWDVTFDSDSNGAFPCDAVATPGPHEDCTDPAQYLDGATMNGTVRPSGDLADFNGASASGDWTITVSDGVGGDGGCFKGFSMEIDYIIGAAIPAVAMDNCAAVVPTFSDAVYDQDCKTGIDKTIVRRWVAADAKGNTSNVCIQNITVEAITIGDIPLPPAKVELPCGSDISPDAIEDYYDDRDPITHVEFASPTNDNTRTEIIENNEGTAFAFPHYFAGPHAQRLPEAGLCGVYADYKDHVIGACGDHCHGNKKVLRTWTLLNWCTHNYEDYVQIITAKDTEAPTFIVNDTTVTTRPWDCTGEFMLPSVWELHDNCDITPGYYVTGPAGVSITPKVGGGYLASGAPKGKHDFYYTAYDCCGNEYTDTVTIAVLDKVAPVVTTKQDIVVSLTPGGPGADGQAKLFTHHIDNGSFDVCTGVHKEIRRADDAPQCGNDGLLVGNVPYNNNKTFNSTTPRFQTAPHPNDNRSDTDNGEFVKFCCEDITAEKVDANGDGIIDTLDRGYVMVIIRVWDDANMSGVYGDEAVPFPDCKAQRDNYNEGWAYVKVEDKLPPVLHCPAPATIYCDWAIDMSTDFPDDAVQGGWVPVSVANFEKTGIATAFSTCGAENVEFKDTDQTDKCGVGTIVRQFRTSNQSKTGPKTVVCQQVITVLARPTEFVVIPPVKNPIIINECTLTPEIIEAARNNPSLANRFPRVSGGVCDVIGENIKVDTFLFEDGVCKKWRVQFSYYNWCDHEEFGPYDVIFFYEDTEKPEITMCQDTMYGVDANCEHILTVSNSATDGGGCIDNGWLKWQVFVDTWGDGKIDHYASFYRGETRWTRIERYLANGTTNPAWEALPAGQDYADYVWVKNVGATSSGGVIEVEIEKEVIKGKMSNHKVHWKVTDGCHNFASCSQEIMVADKKAPTPYCVNLSTALMNDNTVELWARDFDNGSFDNCTPQEDLLFTFFGMNPVLDLIDDVHYFTGAGVESTESAYLAGNAQKWNPAYKSSSKIFDCDEYTEAQNNNGEYMVNMTVWDKKLNSDFCMVTLKLINNQGDCGNRPAGRVAGNVHTEVGDDLADVQVTIEGNINDLTKVQVVNGTFDFDNLPENVDYELTAEKDVDYMNGVSTLDLVLIQRHILGLQELNSAYKMIAADVSNDNNIRANDLVELRKLILGVTSDFTATSWKMVDANEVVEASTPLVYSEKVFVDNLQSQVASADFMAVKMGDVNGNAKANIRSNSTEPRSNTTINLMADEQLVEAGQTVSVDITSNNFNEVFGYQFTTELNGLTLTGVRSGAIEMSDDNVGLPKAGVVTASWASDALSTVAEGEVLFTLDFVATANGNLSGMMQINSNVTAAESYTGAEMNVSDIALTFRTETGDATAVYALGQNEPNPFKDVTKVTYEMAEAGAATFTLYDVTGKVLVVKTEEADKGLNTVEFKADEIKASGIVYYQIESGDFTATKKMIIIE